MHPNVKHIIRFCLLLLIQTQVLDNIIIKWWAQPYGFPVFVPFIYPLFLLLLPYNTPAWLLMIAGFLAGLSVDIFYNTAGMHAFAMVLIAYVRTPLLNLLLPNKLSDYGSQSPNIKNMIWLPFFTYTATLIFIHHFAFFIIEIWSLKNLGYLLLKITVSALTSLLLVLCYVLLFTKDTALRK